MSAAARRRLLIAAAHVAAVALVFGAWALWDARGLAIAVDGAWTMICGG